MASNEVENEQQHRGESAIPEKPPTPEEVSSAATTSATPSSPNPLPAPSDRLRSVTDAAFRFIGNASNETLGACAIGLCASTYLVLGRLGLVLIGAFGGAILHATWEGSGSPSGDGTQGELASRKKRLGVEIVKRALSWRDIQRVQTEGIEIASEDKVEASTTQKALDYATYPPATASALNAFTDAVIQDYVKWWYQPILPADKTFPADCRQILTAFIHSFSNHVSRKRAADPFLTFFADSTSVLVVFLQELASALKASQRQDVEEALSTYLKYQPDSNLANVINQEQQKQKLHLVADDILQNFLDSKTYNCLPARSFLREVLAGLILDGSLVACSKPEWINGWIVYLLEDGEPELMNAIDAGVGELQGKVSDMPSPMEGNARKTQHQRRVSRAEQAMEEAVQEAQRINAMIAEEEARKKQVLPATDSEDALSIAATTDTGIATPMSSESGQHLQAERAEAEAMVFDSEGNNMPSVTTSPVKQPAIQHTTTFTSFDQLGSQLAPTVPQTTYEAPAPSEVMVAIPLTLHNATINIMDLGESNDQIPLKQRPNSSMLVQIEPAASRFPGWMVERQYAAFEPLHETLRRLAQISGVPEFSLKYPELPPWRGRTRAALINDLTVYLGTALKAERLAESEAMKRFLDKETGLSKAPAANKNVILQGGAALENVGKGFINVLGQGGKGLQTGFQTGGKAVLGGVTNVFGAVAGGVGGPKRPGMSTNNSTASQSSPYRTTNPSSRQSQDILRSGSDLDSQTRGSPQPVPSSRSSTDYFRTSKDLPRASTSNSAFGSTEQLNLPPPPDQITDEFEPVPRRSTQPQQSLATQSSRPATPTSSQQPLALATPSPEKARQPIPEQPNTLTPPQRRKQDVPINIEETKMTVDLLFAIITELLSLSSSTWTFRLSLLTAAKTYLLRQPAQLDSIRALLQESIIDANFSDEGMATHIRKLRENVLPTEEELAKWPKEMSTEEKERLRLKARRLLVERGMPATLTTVVGVAASGEALGRVFDCLQVQEIARGLIFALMLQGIRSVTQ
ncbi:hypothetical protein H2198_010406 [Neophaeococcomyces mojaviensis]|uniref:Uncharacterized protein n=1 Tax=Neophaeococcomyces mojaviensis TaxID=3383035 RepID=A0ACC2ZRU4_9EURO|nr:hypothetical protein H2198_010406 [Knufia sp. JES_112]